MGLFGREFTQGLYRGLDQANQWERQAQEERRIKLAEDQAKQTSVMHTLLATQLQNQLADQAALPGDITDVLNAAEGGARPTLGGAPVDPMDVSDLAGQNLIEMQQTQGARTLPQLRSQVSATSLARIMKYQPSVITDLKLKAPEDVRREQEQQSGMTKAMQVFGGPAPADTEGRLGKLREATQALVEAKHPLGAPMFTLLAGEWGKDPEVPAAFANELSNGYSAAVANNVPPEKAITTSLMSAIQKYPGIFRSQAGMKFVETFKKLLKPEELKGFSAGTDIYQGNEYVGSVPEKGTAPTAASLAERAANGDTVASKALGLLRDFRDTDKSPTLVDLALNAADGDERAKAAIDAYRGAEGKSADKSYRRAEWILNQARQYVQASQNRLAKITQTPEEFDAAVAAKAAQLSQGEPAEVEDIVRQSTGAASPAPRGMSGRTNPLTPPGLPRAFPGRPSGPPSSPRSLPGRDAPQAPSPPPVSGLRTFADLPDPEAFAGKTIRDTRTGQRYRSNGVRWDRAQ